MSKQAPPPPPGKDNNHDHNGGHRTTATATGMRKIRRIFGRTSHSSSKNSTTGEDETGTDEALDEAQPGSSSSQPLRQTASINSSTSSGHHHHSLRQHNQYHNVPSNVSNMSNSHHGDNRHGSPGSVTSPTPIISLDQQQPLLSPSPSPLPPVATFVTAAELEPILTELTSRRNEVVRLQEEFDSAKTQMQSECSLLHQTLQEERYRFERIEEQMNDLIELHQNEIENLKQGIGDMEEKIQYQSEERLRDVYEMLDSCQTRISRMEHQQHQHLQQLVNLDSLENTNARALVLKLINVLLTILQVILLLVATFASILTPFLQTRVRILTTLLFLLLFMVLFRQRKEVFTWIKFHFKDQFPILELILNTQPD